MVSQGVEPRSSIIDSLVTAILCLQEEAASCNGLVGHSIKLMQEEAVSYDSIVDHNDKLLQEWEPGVETPQGKGALSSISIHASRG